MNKYIAPAILTAGLFVAPECAAEVPSAAVVTHEIKQPEPDNPGAPDIHVEWDGTVFEATPDPGRYNYSDGYGYINLTPIGKIASQSLKDFINWEKGFYPDETLENGAVIFEQGNTEDCGARVTREGGGWSYPEASGEDVPEDYCRDIGSHVFPS